MYRITLKRILFCQGSNMNLGEALEFLREYDWEASGMCFRVTSSQWNYSTNITETNKRRMVSFIS
jgi:peptidyl-dipeptidase A